MAAVSPHGSKPKSNGNRNASVASVVAVSYCELYELHRHAFEELAPQFQKTFDGFKQAASLLAKQFKT